MFVIPALAVFLTWLKLFLVARRLGWGRWTTAGALALAIFGSPLTFYGAVFWEHSLAVCLGFWGTCNLLIEDGRRDATRPTLYGGALLTMSVWFRGECVFLAAPVLIWCFIRLWWTEKRPPWTLLISSSLPVVILLVGNAVA